MMQPGAGTLLHFSLEGTEQRDHHGDGAAGVLQEDGVTKIESADGFGGGTNLGSKGGIHTGWSAFRTWDWCVWLHERGQSLAERLLQCEAVLEFRDVILDDRGHRSLQFAGQRLQKLEMLGGLLVPG